MAQWPADQVERRPITSLVPSARNARQHSEAQIEQLKASIREWGWTMPILVDEAGMIIAGHGRVVAADQLGLDQVPVMVARGWSEAQKRAYLIADNKLSENASWDQAMLQMELHDIEAMGFDALLTGFTENEIEAMGQPENDPLAEWAGMPEFEQNKKDAFQTIALHFKDAEAVEKFSKLIDQPITDKTKFVWYPPAEIESYNDKQFTAAAE